jgi:hypothetical protein
MRRILVAIGLTVLLLTPFSSGAPIEGTAWMMVKVPEGRSSDGVVSEPGHLQYNRTFVAGQRACVVAIGDHKPPVDVEIKVFDAKNQVVAQDKGQGPAQDFAAVMWYPPRQEQYRIEVYNYGKEYNECSIAFK